MGGSTQTSRMELEAPGVGTCVDAEGATGATPACATFVLDALQQLHVGAADVLRVGLGCPNRPLVFVGACQQTHLNLNRSDGIGLPHDGCHVMVCPRWNDGI